MWCDVVWLGGFVYVGGGWGLGAGAVGLREWSGAWEELDVALVVGDPMAMSAATHGMRRGYACDLALAGAPLQRILEEGDWRSEAFRVYLESVKDQLHNRALMGILGDNSDDEE